MLRYFVPVMAVLCLLSYGCGSGPPSTKDRSISHLPQPGTGVLKTCTERPPSYTAAVESQLKAVLPLIGKTEAEADLIVKGYLRLAPGGTQDGEDFNNYMFYICQMANNGNWSEEGTQKLIVLYMEVKRTDPKAEQERKDAVTKKEGRAWVTVKFLGLCKDTGPVNGCVSPSVDDKRRFKVEIKNSGKTPSLKTLIRFCIRPQVPETIDQEWIRKDCKTTEETSISILGPDQVLASFAIDRRTSENRNIPLYSFGLIEYEDVYKVPHWTAFCFRSPNANGIDIFVCAQAKSNAVDDN